MSDHPLGTVPVPVPQDRPYLTRQEAADYLGIPVATLKYWATLGNGPVYYKVGRHTRYLRSDLDAWVASRAAR